MKQYYITFGENHACTISILLLWLTLHFSCRPPTNNTGIYDTSFELHQNPFVKTGNIYIYVAIYYFPIYILFLRYIFMHFILFMRLFCESVTHNFRESFICRLLRTLLVIYFSRVLKLSGKFSKTYNKGAQNTANLEQLDLILYVKRLFVKYCVVKMEAAIVLGSFLPHKLSISHYLLLTNDQTNASFMENDTKERSYRILLNYRKSI